MTKHDIQIIAEIVGHLITRNTPHPSHEANRKARSPAIITFHESLDFIFSTYRGNNLTVFQVIQLSMPLHSTDIPSLSAFYCAAWICCAATHRMLS